MAFLTWYSIKGKYFYNKSEPMLQKRPCRAAKNYGSVSVNVAGSLGLGSGPCYRFLHGHYDSCQVSNSSSRQGGLPHPHQCSRRGVALPACKLEGSEVWTAGACVCVVDLIRPWTVMYCKDCRYMCVCV